MNLTSGRMVPADFLLEVDRASRSANLEARVHCSAIALVGLPGVLRSYI